MGLTQLAQNTYFFLTLAHIWIYLDLQSHNSLFLAASPSFPPSCTYVKAGLQRERNRLEISLQKCFVLQTRCTV